VQMQSLKSKLLLTVSALVIASGIFISLWVTHRYSQSLIKEAIAQAENIAHAVALESTDIILINDRVALQKMLDNNIQSNPSISYLFIIRNSQLLAHTFPKGIPVELISANEVVEGNHTHLKRIKSKGGDDYLDIAWPIFSGKAGVLRLGISENPYKRQVTRLWVEMSAATLGILLLALVFCFLFIGRITEPLTELSDAVENIDEKNLDTEIQLKGDDEVGKLAASFNRMVDRIKDYTLRLEKNAKELDRAHNQTRSCFAIVQEIGALPNLKDVGSYLIQKFQGVLACKEMVLLVFTDNRDTLFALSEQEARLLKEKSVEDAVAALEGLKGMTVVNKDTFTPPIVPDNFKSAKHFAVFPLHHENQPLGAMMVACPGNCLCDKKEMELLGLILNQTSGAIKRAVLQEKEMRNLQRRVESSTGFNGIIGKDPKMHVIYKLIEDISPTDANVLVQGESGTGKELVARSIHHHSLRKDGPFVVVNCSAYPSTLLESELFGHEKGAFTGAIRQKLGRFEQAHKGTVFLDEIGEISPSAQIKLLRVIQTQKFERLGGEETIDVDVRIIAATNKDLLQAVQDGQFREDLYYRLHVIPILLPPLGKRSNDIPLLARHFLNWFATEQGKEIHDFSSEAMRMLLDYFWPGNVRELENSIEHAAVLAKGNQIEIYDLPSALHKSHTPTPDRSHRTIMENERRLLLDVLGECDWNKKKAASRLGISRSSLYSKLKKYQITNPTVH